MIMNRAFVVCSAILLGSAWGCSTSGGVSLRPDGTPGPQECSEKALETMRILRLRVGDAADVDLDMNQADVTPIRLYDGPIESMLNENLGPLESPTRLYGQVWTGGPQVVIRYYEAHPPNGDKIPICAVARLAKGQLRKLPGSVPGMAIVEFSVASAYIVDSFR